MDKMVEWVANIHFWHWFALGGILLLLEVVGFAGFLFWIGIAAALTGIIAWIFPSLAWTYQCLFFAAASIVVAIGWWYYLRHHPIKTDKPRLNRRSEQYIDRVFTLQSAIINNRGYIDVDDSRWKVQCEHDLAEGTKIRVTGVDGVVLIVEAVETME